MRIRRLILTFHLWIGLVVAIPFILMALTGAILEFRQEADTPHVPVVGSPQTAAALWQRIQTQYPRAKPVWAGFGDSPGEAYIFAVNMPVSGGGKPVFQTFVVNQYTGQIGDPQPDKPTAMVRIEKFHRAMSAGRFGGSFLVPYTTVAVTFLVLTGLILWWPYKIFTIRTRGSSRRLTFYLHSAIGIYAAAFLLIMTGTGIMLHWRPIGQWIVKVAGQQSAQTASKVSTRPQAAAPSLSLDQVAVYADAHLPGSRTTKIVMPGNRRNPVTVFRSAGDGYTGDVVSYSLDQYSGAVLASTDFAHEPWARRFNANLVEMHDGTQWGWPGRIIAFLVALLTPLLPITGLLMWWRKRARFAKEDTRSLQP